MKINKYNLVLILALFTKMVGAQAPASWVVDQNQFTNKFYVTCSAELSCTDLNNDSVVIAAFVGGDCRGVVHTNTTSANGKIGFLIIGSNTNNELINFKFYDYVNDVVVNALDTLMFSSGAHVGTISDPFKMVDNHSPTNLALSSSSVNNNGLVPMIIGTVTAQDQDSLQVLGYSLTTGYGDNANFSIVNDSLQLTTAVSQDSTSVLYVEIEVTDNAGCSYTEQFEISIISTAGIKEDNNFNFILYPNPTNGVFNIKGNAPVELIQVFDTEGRLLISKTNTNSINIEYLAKGMYWVNINSVHTVTLFKN